VWAVCNASEQCSSKQIEIKSPLYARLEGVPYSSLRPAPDGMRSGFKCTAGREIQYMGMTTRGQRTDRYNVPTSWASSHNSQCWNHIFPSHVPPAGHYAGRPRCMGAIVPDAILDQRRPKWITRIVDSSLFAHCFFSPRSPLPRYIAYQGINIPAGSSREDVSFGASCARRVEKKGQ